MQIISDIDTIRNNGTIATLGFFDGVHKGHRFLIEHIKRETERLGLQSMVITFDQHPRKVLNQDFQPKLLNTFEEKMALLSATGVDICCVLPFTKKLATLSSQEFLINILHDKLKVKKLIVGYDHRFGHNREDSFEQYQQYGKAIDISIEQSAPYKEKGVAISSSIIRRLLEKGVIEEANHYLGYEYFLSGKVIHGQKIGRTIHFPTANIEIDDCKELPINGIYAVRIKLNGQMHNGMLNLGTRPTVDKIEAKTTVEVNIFDFDDDIYGETITVSFVKRIRDEQKFPSIEQLAEQLKKDEQAIREIL